MADTDDTDLAIDELLANQKAAQRRSAMLLGGAVLALVGGVAAVILLQPDPKCRSSDVQALLNEPGVPGYAVGMACDFGPPLGQGLKELGQVPSQMRRLVAAKVVAESAMKLEKMCPGAVRALADSAALVPSEAPAAFLKVCDLSVIGVEPTDRYPVMGMALAALVFLELKDSDSSVAKPIARKLLSSF